MKTNMVSWIAIVFVSAFFLIHWIWPIYIFFHDDYFAYLNGWDEYTYLSYQGAVGSYLVPGYFSSMFTVLFHQFGMGANVQNLLWDLIVPLTMFVCSYYILKRSLQLTQGLSIFYASLITFGSILFNQGNPLIFYFSYFDLSHFVSAMEAYASIWRTPNPQISYFLIFLCGALYYRFRKMFLLFLPIPFLYWSVMVPYIYILACYLLWEKVKWPKRDWKIAVLINLSIIAAMGGGFWVVLSWLNSSMPTLSEASSFLDSSVTFLYSPILLINAMVILACLIGYFMYKIKFHLFWLMTLSLCILFITNFQLFTRKILDPKNFQDSAATILISIIVVLVIHGFYSYSNKSAVVRRPKLIMFYRILGCLLMFYMLSLLALSQGFNPKTLDFHIQVNPKILSPSLDFILAHPSEAIVPNELLSSRITMLAPRVIAPPLSNHYGYPLISKQCARYEMMNLYAYDYFQKLPSSSSNTEEYSYFTRNYQQYINVLNQTKQTPYAEPASLCEQIPPQPNYYEVKYELQELKTFPNWSPTAKIWIERITAGPVFVIKKLLTHIQPNP
jgi:hypothetical protein